MNLKTVKQKVNTLVAVHIIICLIVNLIKVGQMRVMDFKSIIIFIPLYQVRVHSVFAMIVKEINCYMHIHVNGQKNSIKRFSKVTIGMKYKTN